MEEQTPAQYSTRATRKHARAGAATAYGLLVGMDATTPDGRALASEPAAGAFMRAQAGAALGAHLGAYIVEHMQAGGRSGADDLARVITDYLRDLATDMVDALL